MAPEKPSKAKKPRNYTTATDKAGDSKAAASKTTKVSASKATASKASTAKAAPADKKPAPNMQERIEGLQGWMAEIERRQARMTYFGGAAALVAIAASAGALYLGITTKDDAATKDDVDEIQNQLKGTQTEVQ